MPTYRPLNVGLQYSEALADAYIHAPADDPVLVTLELVHPDWAEPIRVVNDWRSLTATLEADAPEDPGAAVVFSGIPFRFSRTAETDGGAPAAVTITVDDLNAAVTQMVMDVQESEEPIRAILRTYLPSDTSAPHELPVIKMWVESPVVIQGFQAVLQCSFGDLTNRRFPRLLYKRPNLAPSVVSILLLHGDGTNGSTTITDSSPAVRVPSSNIGVTISTAQSLYGGASLLAPASQSELLYASSTDFADEPPFTIEFSLRLTALPASGFYFMAKSATEYFTISAAGELAYVNNTSATIGTLSVGTWYRVAVSCESSGTDQTRVFLNGVLTETGTNSTVSSTAQPFSVVSVPSRADLQSVRGYMDEVRYVKGQAIYLADYTPTGPFPDT